MAVHMTLLSQNINKLHIYIFHDKDSFKTSALPIELYLVQLLVMRNIHNVHNLFTVFSLLQYVRIEIGHGSDVIIKKKCVTRDFINQQCFFNLLM